MQKPISSLFTKSALLIVLSFSVACGGPKVNRAFNKQTVTELTAEETTPKSAELEPTLSDEKIQRIFKNIAYEAPEKTIETKQATLHLQQVKMKDVKMKYDPVQRNFMVQGHAFILDENKKEIADSTFSLAAVHAADDSVFRLSKTDNVKVNSKEKPVVRAKVTCLSVHSDDTMDCSNAVVDFFIAYKKKIYTEQMETQSPTNPVSPKEPKTGAVDEDADDDAFGDGQKSDDAFSSASTDGKLQSESEEDSVLGRYQGQVQNTDLSKEFDDDDDIQSEIKPLPKKEPKKKKEKKPKTDSDKKDSDKDKDKDSKNSGTPTTPSTPLPLDPKTPKPSKPDIKVDGGGVKPGTPTKEKEDDEEADEDQDDGDDDIVGTKINSDSATTSDGKIRPLNQAIGLPNKGSLRNATSMVDRQKANPGLFEVFNPSRAFATYEMAEIITRMGKKLTSAFSKKLNLSDISQKRGGALSPHLSHQIGMDADIAYPSSNDRVKFPAVVHGGSYDASVYSIEKTYELLKFTYSQKDLKVDRIFIDRKIKKNLCDFAKAKGELAGKDRDLVQRLFNNMEHVDGHGDHFHLRMRCTPAHPACRDKVYAKVETCG